MSDWMFDPDGMEMDTETRIAQAECYFWRGANGIRDSNYMDGINDIGQCTAILEGTEVFEPETYERLENMKKEARVLGCMGSWVLDVEKARFPRYFRAHRCAFQGMRVAESFPDGYVGMNDSRWRYVGFLTNMRDEAYRKMDRHEERRDDVLKRIGDVIIFESNLTSGDGEVTLADWNRIVDMLAAYDMAVSAGKNPHKVLQLSGQLALMGVKTQEL